MSIKESIFFVESFAHLQGHEAKLLPIVDAARDEHSALVEALRTALDESEQCLSTLGMPLISPEWHQLAKTAVDKASAE